MSKEIIAKAEEVVSGEVEKVEGTWEKAEGFGEETGLSVSEKVIGVVESKGFMPLDDVDFAAEIMNRKLGFCTFDQESEEGQRLVYKVTNDPDFSTKDMVNTPISLSGVYVETVELAKKQEGSDELLLDEYGNTIRTKVPRVVLVDTEGKTYQSCSFGVYYSIKSILMAFGTPDKWTKPLVVVPKTVSKAANKNSLTLKLK